MTRHKFKTLAILRQTKRFIDNRQYDFAAMEVNDLINWLERGGVVNGYGCKARYIKGLWWYVSGILAQVVFGIVVMLLTYLTIRSSQ